MIDKSEIIGKTVLSVFINEKMDILKFNTAQGPFYLATSGDCCSESWVEHINVPYIPFTISDVVEKELGEAVGTRQDVDLLYVSSLISERGGSFIIEFRNSSNGYYGGYATHVDEKYLPPNTKWTEIKEDF